MTKPFTYEQAWAIHKFGEAMAELGVLHGEEKSVEELTVAGDEAHRWWIAIQTAFDAHWPSVSEQLEGTGIEHEVYYGD